MIARLLPGLDHVQNIHPLVVHFPIALLSAGVLLYFFALVAASEPLKWTALWVLALGALGAIVALATGLYIEDAVMVAPSVREALLHPHKRLMIASSAIAIALTGWAFVARPMPERGRYVFLIGLLAMLALIVKGADYGGRMVFDYNAGGNACNQPIDFSK